MGEAASAFLATELTSGGSYADEALRRHVTKDVTGKFRRRDRIPESRIHAARSEGGNTRSLRGADHFLTNHRKLQTQRHWASVSAGWDRRLQRPTFLSLSPLLRLFGCLQLNTWEQSK